MVARFFIKKDPLLQNVLNLDKKIVLIMKYAKFVFTFDSEEEVRIISISLMPEIKQKIPKTNVKLSVFKNKFFLEIEAKDTSSLRAACNSYLRWINTALNVKKTV